VLIEEFVVRIEFSKNCIFDCRTLQLLRNNSLAKASRLLRFLGKRKCNELSCCKLTLAQLKPKYQRLLP